MARSSNYIFLTYWHRMLGLSRQCPPSWYRDRLVEELRERRAAKTTVQKLSETSDVFFSLCRARHDGFPIRFLPPFWTRRTAFVYMYMVAKYTSRWQFYRTTAWLCKTNHYASVREVVNPGKDSKLDEVALRHRIDVGKFRRVGTLLRRVWPLLP